MLVLVGGAGGNFTVDDNTCCVRFPAFIGDVF